MLKNVKYFKNIWISQLSILKRFKAVLLKNRYKLSTLTKKVPQNALFYVCREHNEKRTQCMYISKQYIYISFYQTKKNIILYLSYFQILINYFADFSKIIAKMFGSLNPLPYLCCVETNKTYQQRQPHRLRRIKPKGCKG